MQDDYEQGMLDALELLRKQRESMEAPLRNMQLGPASESVWGAMKWGDALQAATEKQVLAVLRDRIKTRR